MHPSKRTGLAVSTAHGPWGAKTGFTGDCTYSYNIRFPPSLSQHCDLAAVGQEALKLKPYLCHKILHFVTH
jgi:hypothetical protein